MFTLFHHPFCPHSRFIRLVLGEYGLDLQLVEERVWERREAFLLLNPAGTTPLLTSDGIPPVPGAGIIAEYLDETHGAHSAELDKLNHLSKKTRTRGGRYSRSVLSTHQILTLFCCTSFDPRMRTSSA